MTVNISKPSINIREKLSELDKPSGIAGEAVLRADSVQDVRDSINAGRRNLIINGGFDVWQRGTSIARGSGNTYHSADRFLAYTNSAGNARSTDVPSESPHTYSMKVDDFTGSFIIDQLMEVPTGTVGPFKAGTNITISYWAKGTTHVKLMNRLMFRQSGGSSTNEVSPAGLYDHTKSNSLSSSWQKFSQTYTMPAGVTVGSGIQALNLSIRSSDGVSAVISPAAADEIFITGIQVELGSVATDFEHRSYGEELALCQRYCYVIGHPSQVIYLGTGSMYTSTAVNLSVPLPVQLRSTSPSFTRVTNGTGNWLNVYVGATGTVSNASPLQGDYTQSNLRIYMTGAHSGSSPSAPGAGVWSMVLAGAKLIISSEL